MKIIVDGMLGDLAKWLRLLGIDTRYERNMEDEVLLEEALKENAILITGDEELSYKASKRNIKVILIKKNKTRKELLKQLLKELKLDENEINIGSRCILCNSILKSVDKAFAIKYVPKKVGSMHSEFWYCENCNKIYWYGSHWKKIEMDLDEILGI